MNRLVTAALIVFASAVVGAPVVRAQSIWGTDGATAMLGNQAGPPVAPCGYPNGPTIGGMPTMVPFFCPVPGLYPAALSGGYPMGDVTVDRISDIVWATDGLNVTSYTKAGVPIASFPVPLPIPVTGLGWSAPIGANPALLWLTDGYFCCAIVPPALGCAFPPFYIAPFLVTPTSATSIATDVDFDPISGTLFFAHTSGFVSNEFPTGGLGPFGIFLPVPPCPLLPLTGLAVDTASCGTLFITDSVAVTRINFFGAPAPTTFYAPMMCWPWVATGPTSGLGFDATPITFGKGSDPAGSIPTIGSTGEAISPNPGFGITLGNATPGGAAYLLLAPSSACPVVPIGFGAFIHVFPISSIIGPFPIPTSGGFAMPAPMPAGFACSGLTAYLEWLVVKPSGGGLETSPGLHVRPAAP